jgi:hypothetical protein
VTEDQSGLVAAAIIDTASRFDDDEYAVVLSDLVDHMLDFWPGPYSYDDVEDVVNTLMRLGLADRSAILANLISITTDRNTIKLRTDSATRDASGIVDHLNEYARFGRKWLDATWQLIMHGDNPVQQNDKNLLGPAATNGDEPTFPAFAPASDRLVRIDHNAEAVREIREAAAELVQRIRLGNDLGDLTAEEAAAAANEVYQIGLFFEAEYVRPATVLSLAGPTLRWIADKTGGAVVGAAALALLALIKAFL